MNQVRQPYTPRHFHHWVHKAATLSVQGVLEPVLKTPDPRSDLGLVRVDASAFHRDPQGVMRDDDGDIIVWSEDTSSEEEGATPLEQEPTLKARKASSGSAGDPAAVTEICEAIRQNDFAAASRLYLSANTGLSRETVNQHLMPVLADQAASTEKGEFLMLLLEHVSTGPRLLGAALSSSPFAAHACMALLRSPKLLDQCEALAPSAKADVLARAYSLRTDAVAEEEVGSD